VRLEGAWGALRQLRDFRPAARTHPDPDLLAARAPRRVAPFRAVATLAVAAALAVAAIGWYATGKFLARPTRVFATTVDGYERVALQDGSLLELNASSEVRVRFTKDERRVQLIGGEAHFMVAKNPARPFRVEAGAVVVRAVGTAFNVRIGTNEVEVLVTEGRVEVGQNAGAAAATGSRDESDLRNGGPASLLVNQRAIVSTQNRRAAAPVVETLAPAAIREALAWQGPRLTFVDTPLSAVVLQFNRHNPVQLVIRDAELGALPIGGSFRAENLDGFVRLLEQGGDIVVERPDPTQIVLARKK